MADEPSLLNFQRELMERLSNARVHPGGLGHAGFESANQPFLLALADVRAIVMAADFTRIPLADASFRGLINFQGELVGVIDPAALLRQSLLASEVGAKSAVIILHKKFGLNAGLLAGRMAGLRDCQKWGQSPLNGAPQWVTSELIDEQGVRWRVVDPAALLEAIEAREFVPAA
jgi:twitching motility protein PilI